MDFKTLPTSQLALSFGRLRPPVKKKRINEIALKTRACMMLENYLRGDVSGETRKIPCAAAYFKAKDFIIKFSSVQVMPLKKYKI